MKRYFLFASVMLALAAVSCNGGGNGSTSGNVSQSSEGQPVADSVAQAQDNAATPSVLMPGAVGKGNASASATAPEKKKLEAPKVPVTPETPTDNDELVALIQSSQQDGKLDEAKVKAFAHLGKQIEALDKEGKLSTNQKELFKVASDAYTKLINKNQ